jgi:ACS family tartrate transporter-like MFS transporter
VSDAIPELEAATLRRVTRRLIPFMFVLYIANYLDRVNVSFAALHMNRDLGFSSAAYGLGAGMFFLGYCLFQIPSNLVLARVGARRWIGGLMITWGVIASAMMLVRGVGSFYALRALLGVVEAGFFPGMILYLTYWFPGVERARAVAGFMTAIPISGVVGGPLSGALLGLNGVAGLAGWQWLFLLEGLPSVLLGAAALWYLTDRPAEAAWLPAEGRAWLAERVGREQARAAGQYGTSLRHALLDGVVWRLGLLYFLIIVGLYGQGLWLPQIIKGSSQLSDLTVGLLSAAPALAAAVAMVAVAAHSDRTGERHRHVAAPLVAGAVGFAATAATLDTPLLATAALSLSAIGFTSALGPFWALPTTFLSGTAAAGGIALINSLGNVAGFAGPYLVGLVKDATGGYAGALLAFALLMLAGAALALALRRAPALRRSAE